MSVTGDPNAAPDAADEPTAESGSNLLTMALAALCAAAGIVHLVMVPGHSQDSTLDGVLFLLAGWAQLGLAVGLVAWPRRVLLYAAAAVNLAVAAAWTVSRTAGLPWGADAGDKEAAATLDQMTTAFEIAAVVLAAALILRPRLGEARNERTLILGGVIPVAVVVATSVVLTAPETANHHQEDAETAAQATPISAAAQRCDLGFNPAAYWEDATLAGYDTVSGATLAASKSSYGGDGAAAASSGGHSHGAAAPAADATASAPEPLPDIDEGRGNHELDQLMALSSREGEGAEARLVMNLSEVSDEAYDLWLQRVPASATHAGPQQWTAMSDQAECDTLQSELEQARDFALAHPTPKEAEAAGYSMVTGYVPGIAAHYMNFSYIDDKFEMLKPEMLLYDGTGENASVVGLSYYITMGAPVEPTQGFTGPNDHYHAHIGLCVKGGVVIGDSTVSEEDCAARGGQKSGGSGNMMSHLWVVPGCESPWGVFSGANPLLDGTLGQASGTDGGSCAGSGVIDRYDLSPGSRGNTPAPVNGTDADLAAG